MKQYTNINIKNQDMNFVYLVEYNRSEDILFSDIMYYINNGINLFTNSNHIIRNGNQWNTIDTIDTLNMDSYITSSIRLYFPEHSIDTYKNTKYILSVNIWVNNKQVNLGNFLLNRLDALASDKFIKFDGHNYCEYIEMQIINPWYIIYDDHWSLFRKDICGIDMINGYELNNIGSQLVFTLYPVINNGDLYIIDDSYDGGQNSLNISNDESDYLTLNSKLSYDIDGVNINNSILFNTNYNNDIALYFKETYDINLSTIKYETVIKDIDNIYHTYTNIISKCRNDFKQSFELDYDDGSDSSKLYLQNIHWADWANNINKIIHNKCNLNSMGLSWNDWKDGMTIISSVSFYDDLHEEIIYIFSNEILLTKELFSYICHSDSLKKINLNKESIKNMKIYNINAVNKIINEVIKIDKPEDSKSNIIQPVFFKVKNTADLILHPAVTENICINLDDYKSKVDTFMLQVENCTFRQIGANAYGIIFKIIGQSLQNKINKGTYYILDQNKELVTTGKYIYE